MRTYLSLSVLGLALCIPFVGCTGSIGGNTSPGGDDPRQKGGQGANAAAGEDEAGIERVVPTSRFARLSHKQWENTVRDLLYLPKASGLSGTFTGDAVSGRFDNASGALQVTEALFGDYQQAAEALATRASADSGIRSKLLPANLPTDAVQRRRAFVEAFGKRAFRRPLTAAEVDIYAGLYAQGQALFGEGDATTAGVRAVVEAMLQSPHFLYRLEGRVAESAPGGKQPLTGYELASRLSYGLTNSMPDEELFAAAEEGRLEGSLDQVRAQVRSQVARLFNSAGGREAVRDFHAQLLRLHTYDAIDKDPAKVSGFSKGIGTDMRQETLKFVAEVIHEQDGGVTDLFSAPFTFVNKRLAPIYGVQGNFGEELVKVDLNPAERAGLLTQSGFLASNAHLDQIDSIHRGVFVHLNVLCTDLPAPSDDVPPLPVGGGKTNRERVDAHTGPGTCGGRCHGIINPAGFAFEGYDAVGKFRTVDGGHPIDDSGELDIGEPAMKWTNGVQFVKMVAGHLATHRCMTRAWLEYLYGRRPVDDDDIVINKTALVSLLQNKSISDLVADVLTQESFLYRAAL